MRIKARDAKGWALVVALVCLGMAACGGGESDSGSGSSGSSSTPSSGSAGTGSAGSGSTATPPAAPVDPPSPPAASADGGGSQPAETASYALGDAEAGGKHYASLCSSCHGLRGAGDGPVSAGLNPKPVAHTDGGYMNALTNEHLFKVVKYGGGAVGKSALMAPWGGTLNDDQIRDVMAFVRSLAVPPYEGG